jgi:hypothetical protein
MAYTCSNPETYEGKTVGNGQCVAFVKKAADAPETARWTEGANVREDYLTIPAGTAIATFVDGEYPNRSTGNHAAFFVSGDADGVVVWDQWSGQPVHKRKMRFRNGKGSPSNDASAFSVIE